MFNLKRHKKADRTDADFVSDLADKGSMSTFPDDLKNTAEETRRTIGDGTKGKKDIKNTYDTTKQKETFDDFANLAYLKLLKDKYGDDPKFQDILNKLQARAVTKGDMDRFKDVLDRVMNNKMTLDEQMSISGTDVQNAASSMFDRDFPLIDRTLRQQEIVRQTPSLASSKEKEKTAQLDSPSQLPENPSELPILPVENIGDFISKIVKIVLSGNEKEFNSAQSEISSVVSSGLEQEVRSAFDSLRDFFNNPEEEEEIASILTRIYGLIPDTQGPNAAEPVASPSIEEPVMAQSFNLSKYAQKMQKEAYYHVGDAYFLYGPTEKRVCPKLRGRGGGKVGGSDVVSEEICRFHCLDGIVIDDNKTICGEALWRANVMDKFSRDYVDEDGNLVGGYLNKRFEINRNVPEENKMRLKPGETRKPRPPEWGVTESRMQAMRNKEGQARGYRPAVNTGQPFDWQKDIDQNNVGQSQEERDRREEAMGHQTVQYTNKEQLENHPKLAKTAQRNEENEKKSFNLQKYRTAANPTPKFSDRKKVNSPVIIYQKLVNEIATAKSEQELNEINKEAAKAELPDELGRNIGDAIVARNQELVKTNDSVKEQIPQQKEAKSKYPKSETTPYNPWRVCNKSTGGKKESPEAFERCCLPGTFITTEDGGVKTIQEIVPGDKIITHKGNCKKVLKIMVHDVNEYIYRIRASGCPYSLSVTGEHPVYALKSIGQWKSVHRTKYSENPEFISAVTLRIGDAIHCPSIAKINTNINIDEQTATALGIYAAEGYCEGTKNLKNKWKCGHKYSSVRIGKRTERGYRVVFALNPKKDIYLIEFLKRFAASIEAPYSILLCSHSKNVITFNLQSRSFAELCSMHVGHYSQKKKLSCDLMFSSIAVQRAFLGGYLLGDGCVYDHEGHSRISVSSSSIQLIHQIFFMLDRCGICSTMQERHVKGGPQDRSKKFKQWCIVINASNSKKLSDVLPMYKFSDLNHYGRRFNRAACTYGRIINIEKIFYSGKVYNLEIEDDNSYVANLCSVHNCVQHIKEQNRKRHRSKKKSFNLKDHKIAQMTGPRGPVGPDNPQSDDLGLSPDYDYRDDYYRKDRPTELGPVAEEYISGVWSAKNSEELLNAVLDAQKNWEKEGLSRYDLDDIMDAAYDRAGELGIELEKDSRQIFTDLRVEGPPIPKQKGPGYFAENNKSTKKAHKTAEWKGGWSDKGEWKCPKCGTIIGKNLKDEKPFALVKQHQDKCQKQNIEPEESEKTANQETKKKS